MLVKKYKKLTMFLKGWGLKLGGRFVFLLGPLDSFLLCAQVLCYKLIFYILKSDAKDEVICLKHYYVFLVM